MATKTCTSAVAQPIPAGWHVLRIKDLVHLKSGDFLPADRISTSGAYPVLGGNGLRGYTESFTHDGHFVLIGRQGALCGNVNYSTGRFWATEHAVVANPRKTFALRWFGELVRSINLNQFATASAQPGLSVEIISSLLIDPAP
jgi:type I restriction enzyme S subunit